MAKMIGMFGKVDYREESFVYWDWNFGSELGVVWERKKMLWQWHWVIRAKYRGQNIDVR